MRMPRPRRRALRPLALAALVPALSLALVLALPAAPALAAATPPSLGDAAPAGAPRAMPAHPDLLKHLGRKKAAALHLKAVPVDEREMLAILPSEKSAAAVTGTGTALVILWQFVDHPADPVAHPPSAYDELLFSTGTLPTGSMNDFYLENSYGAYGVDGGISGWTTASNTYASYANPDGSQDSGTARQMIIDAVAQLDPTVDFSLYDNDGPDGIPDSGDDDGYVDALFFIHAGPGQEQSGDPADIWSHAWGFSGGLPTGDGVSIYRYSVEPEALTNGSLMSVGVFAHEFGHVLGLPDLYDTDYSSNGIGEWGLMSGGSWNQRAGEPAGSRPAHLTAWCKSVLGWLTPTIVTSSTAGVVIPPAETSPVAYRIFRDGVTSGPEYFLVENRRRIGFDEGLVRRQILLGLPAPEGLVIYHVDETVGGNSSDRHRLVDVVEASPWLSGGQWFEHMDGLLTSGSIAKLSNNNRGDNGDLWPGFSTFNADSTDWTPPRDRDRFADDTVPSAQDYFCDRTGIAVENIALSGQDVVADFTIGAVAKRLDKALGQAVFDFETGTDGWKFCNSYVHQDTDYGSGCAGTGGLWFGLNDPSWVCPPGYGNGWEDFTWQTMTVGPSAQVTIRHKYELEYNYDFAYIEARCAGDPGATWRQIASFTGESGCRTDTYSLPAALFSDCPSSGGLIDIDLRLRFSSDGGWSAQDGAYCGLGWWVDEVSVQDVVTGVDDTPGRGMEAYLMPPRPNPFNPTTSLRFHVPAGAGRAELSILDQRGRHVTTLLSELAPAGGWLQVTWDGRDASGRQQPSGIYFAVLDVDGARQTRKMALVK